MQCRFALLPKHLTIRVIARMHVPKQPPPIPTRQILHFIQNDMSSLNLRRVWVFQIVFLASCLVPLALSLTAGRAGLRLLLATRG
jgi:hypothetical protein